MPVPATTRMPSAVAFGTPQTLRRHVQELLPRMRPDGIAEQRIVVAALQSVMPALLLVGPAARQIGERGDVVVDDRPVAHRRPEDAVAAPTQRVEQRGEPIGRQDAVRNRVHQRHPCYAALLGKLYPKLLSCA